MTEECLKLSAYFGERQRFRHRFVADALLDLFGRHEVATSILLRGVEGFGLKHHLRTDSSLTLSEDLPVVALAVDRRSEIEELRDEATAIVGSGLLTLERARLQDSELPGGPLEGLTGPAKLTIYLGRDERIYRVPAFVAVCDLLRRRDVAGATALVGVDGTMHGDRERARFFSRNADVPMMVIAVGSAEQIGRLLPELGALLRRPLLTVERIHLCKRDGVLLSAPHPLPARDERGLAIWQKLMIYTSEASTHAGHPIHRAITRALRGAGAAGSTTLRGVWGFHGDHEPHGDRPLQLGRRVPTVTTVIDTPERISAWFPIVDELTAERGLVTSEMVPALHVRASEHQRGGLRLARHRF